MKKFIYNIFVFVLPFLIVTIFFEVYLRTINTQYKEKLNGLHKSSKNIEVLILGNSHAAYGVNPNVMTKEAYNMAMVSQSLYYDFEIVKKEINNMPNLKYVILSLDYHTLYFSNQEGTRNNWSYYDYGIDKNIDNITKLSRFWFGYTPRVSFSILTKDIKRRYTSLLNKKYVIDYDIQNDIDIHDKMKKGFLAFKNIKNRISQKELKIRAKKFNNYVLNLNERKANLYRFEKIFQYLSSKNINIILITSPCDKKIVELFNNKVRLNDIKEINYLLKKYNVAYFDYLNLIKDDNMFYDFDHLNKDGALLFSTMLNKDINSLSTKSDYELKN